LSESPDLTGRARNAIKGFLQLIQEMDDATTEVSLGDLVETVIDMSGLKPFYEKERGERGQARLENLQELITAARTFDPENFFTFDSTLQELPEPETLLDEFLNHAALEAGEGQGEPNQDCVQLMTLHSAKGLEFPLVFLAGMEEGLFPHMMSLEEPGRLEEERRLCYVGITRAMQQLFMTYAESRRINGSETYNRMSRFVAEIPDEFIVEVRIKGSGARPAMTTSAPARRRLEGESEDEFEDTGLRLGQHVIHPKFGEGVVLNYEGQGKQARVQVNFKDEGSKWLMMAYANLETL
jgi:DNA helicase-2/ATP-dependent DNA helicase PcrA